MSSEQIQHDIRQRDLWSNNVLIACAATMIMCFLLPVANRSGSLLAFTLVLLLLVTAVGFLGMTLVRWWQWRKQVRLKIAHRQWLGRTI